MDGKAVVSLFDFEWASKVGKFGTAATRNPHVGIPGAGNMQSISNDFVTFTWVVVSQLLVVKRAIIVTQKVRFLFETDETLKDTQSATHASANPSLLRKRLHADIKLNASNCQCKSPHEASTVRTS